MENLSTEIKENAKKIHTEDMKMSIGEIINLYKDKEIVINPAFQRLFIWDNAQKSKFIESILIGIPIPSIFLQQRDNGEWEVIDGLQRLSTIFEFAGILKNPDKENELLPSLELRGTKFLPDLKGIYFDNEEKKSFEREVKLLFKRFHLNLVVIKRESDDTAKYELFDRLNSGGTKLEDQQIRNAIFLVEQPEAIELIIELSKNCNFIEVIGIPPKRIKEAYDNELALRFFAYTEIADKFNNYGSSVKEFLDGYLKDHFDKAKITNYTNSFNSFFDFLKEGIGEKVFHTTNGGFSIGKFEAITIGIFPYLHLLSQNKDFFVNKVKSIEHETWFKDALTANRSYARRRLPIFLKDSVDYFNLNKQND